MSHPHDKKSEADKPVVQPLDSAGVSPSQVAASQKYKNASFRTQSKGYPVPAGHTWADLTPVQRREWFDKHESRWKQRFQREATSAGVTANLNWTRG